MFQQAGVDILETILFMKGRQDSLSDIKEQELSLTYDSIFETLFSYVEMEQQCEQIQKENNELNTINRASNMKLYNVLLEKEVSDHLEFGF